MVGVAKADRLDHFLAPEGNPSVLRPLAWHRSAVRFNILLTISHEGPNGELSYLIDHLKAADPQARHQLLAAPEMALYVQALLNKRDVGADLSVAILSRLAAMSVTSECQTFSWKGKLALDYLPLARRAVRMSGTEIDNPEILLSAQHIRLSSRSCGPVIEVRLAEKVASPTAWFLQADSLEIIDGWARFRDDFDDGNESVDLNSSSRATLEAILKQAVTLISIGMPAALDEMVETARYLSPIRPKDSETKVPSFSSPALPGVIFVGVQQGDGTWTDAQHLAESCVHEHLHNRLYLLDEAIPLTVRSAKARLYFSPWKRTMRGIDGMLHAIYVFSHLAWFWHKVGNRLPELRQYADGCVEEHLEHIEAAVGTIDLSELTVAGHRVLHASRKIAHTLTAEAQTQHAVRQSPQ